MRKVYLLLSMLAIFAVMFSITIANAQPYTTTFLVNVDPYGLGWTELHGIDPVYGEAIYKDLNAPGLTGNAKVTAGDIRLTPVFNPNTGEYYPVGSTVTTLDNDYNTNTYGAAARWSQIKHRDDGATVGAYNFGEFLYKDADANSAVSIGDTRYSKVDTYKVASVVAEGDTDIGGTLLAFKGTTAGYYERFTDNLVTNTAYDYARLFVDIYWMTDMPDNTPQGMRGYQFYIEVDPNVLTPTAEYIGGTGGFVLKDYLANIGSPLGTAVVQSVQPNRVDTSEQILGAVPNGAGDLFSPGKLITLVFIPQQQLAWSPITLAENSLGYQDAGTEQWHSVTLASGSYNFVVPEFPLGIGALMSMVALIPVVYVWRTRPKKKVK